MFESMDIGLKASIISFMKKFGIDETSTEESKIFEDFANYVVISDVIRENIRFLIMYLQGTVGVLMG